jgi:large subunit ribosomal protein L31
MKKQGHPHYQEVLFVDSGTGAKFVCGSTLQPKEREAFEGKEYPVYKLAISSASHPFFTGSKQAVDSEGRMGKFQKKYEKKQLESEAATRAAEAAAAETKKARKKK